MKLLFFLCLIQFFFCNWLIPVTDPTEVCYTLTAKEMLEADDFISPRIYGNFWYDKPIFFYWELILAYSIFGVNEFASRFFPAVFATLGVFATYFFGTKLYNEKIGLTAAIILSTTLEYWYISHAIITDMTLFCCISITLMSFYFGYVRKKFSLYYVSYISAGIAVLTKGPIGFLLPGLIILIFLAFEKNFSHLAKMKLPSGLGIFFAIVALWYLPMTILHGRDFIEGFLGVHNFLRATVTEYTKTNVIYYYTIIFFVGFFPWVFPILYAGIKNFWRERKLPKLDQREKFLLIWAVTVFVVFQSFATKYVTYTLPYMMPIVILFAKFFVRREKFFWRMTAGSVILFLVGLFVAIPICEKNSGKEIAEFIKPMIDEQTLVLSYSNDYPATVVFYTGEKVIRLVDSDDFEKLKPRKMSWTSRNLMPFMEVKDLPSDKKIIAIIDKDSDEEFFADWKMIKELNDYKIYVR